MNNQVQADKYAQEGFLVVMPDQYVNLITRLRSTPALVFQTPIEKLSVLPIKHSTICFFRILSFLLFRFAGDPAPNSTDPAYLNQENPSLIERVKLGVTETAKSFLIDMWLARHTPEKVLPILHDVLERAREEFADAVANGGGVYAAGYCFGAKYVLLLGGDTKDSAAWGQERAKDEEEGVKAKGPGIKAGAIAHGTLITKEDIGGIMVPISMVCVENDQLFPDEVREEGKKTLAAGSVEHEVKVFGGVPHGFAVLGDYEDGQIVEKQKEAFQQMLGWLKSH